MENIMLESADGPLVVKLIDFVLSKVCNLFLSPLVAAVCRLTPSGVSNVFHVLNLSEVVPSVTCVEVFNP